MFTKIKQVQLSSLEVALLYSAGIKATQGKVNVLFKYDEPYQEMLIDAVVAKSVKVLDTSQDDDDKTIII